MNPSLFSSLIGNLEPTLNINRDIVDSPNSGNRTTQRNRSGRNSIQIIVNGNIVQKLDQPLIPDTSPTFKEGYQAVFLENGQVYFGKLEHIRDQKYLKLKDIYYLKEINKDTEAGNDVSSDLNLVKLGSELHGPADEMHINTTKIIFWENLRDDSPVVKTILDYRRQIMDEIARRSKAS